MTTDLDSSGSGGTMRPTQSAEAPTATTPTGPPPRRGPHVAIIATLAALAIAVLIGVVMVVTQSQEETTPEPPPTAGPTATAPAATESAPSPTQDQAPTPEDEAIAAAEAVYREYLRVSDDVTTTGDGDVAAFEAVAIGQALSEAQVAAENYQLAGITRVGNVEVAALTPAEVSLEGEVSEVALEACLDVSGTDLIGPDGESVVSPDDPDRLASTAFVRDYPDRGGWLVARVVAEGQPC